MDFLITNWSELHGHVPDCLQWFGQGAGSCLSVTQVQTSIFQNLDRRNPKQENKTVTFSCKFLSLCLSVSVCTYTKFTATLFLIKLVHQSSAAVSGKYFFNIVLGMYADTLYYYIPIPSGLCRHTHTLTSSMSVLLVCLCVCVWCSLVPIALGSCCSSSFRSSTDEMGEFLTRSTSDEGRGSLCGDGHSNVLLASLETVFLRKANNVMDWITVNLCSTCVPILGMDLWISHNVWF